MRASTLAPAPSFAQMYGVLMIVFSAIMVAGVMLGTTTTRGMVARLFAVAGLLTLIARFGHDTGYWTLPFEIGAIG